MGYLHLSPSINGGSIMLSLASTWAKKSWALPLVDYVKK